MTSLVHIQAFLEVARSGSFATAGRRLSLPRSTISARVRALEERLNVRLLQRTTRRVTLTDEGRRYMEHCEEAITKLVEAEAELSQANRISGTIRLTVPIDMSKRALADVLSAFTDLHTSVRIEVIATDETLDLIANNLDLALRGGAPGAVGLVARKLGEGNVTFHASPRYIATHLPARKLTELSGHEIFDPSQRLPKQSVTNPRFGPIGTRNFELAKMLALRSRGIALLPDGVCANEVESGTLIRLSYPEPVAPLPLYLVTPSRQHVPARVRAFIDFLTTEEIRKAIL